MGLHKTTVHSSINVEGEIETNTKEIFKKNSYVVPPEYFSLGMYLLVPILLSLFVGQFIDRKYHSNGTFTLLLLGLGVVGSFYNLLKLLKK